MPDHYIIRVKGHLEQHWSAWFDGLTIVNEPNGDALLQGAVVDQAALHGLLNKIRDLGLPLVAVIPQRENTDKISKEKTCRKK